jgi:hypothetical protein
MNPKTDSTSVISTLTATTALSMKTENRCTERPQPEPFFYQPSDDRIEEEKK